MITIVLILKMNFMFETVFTAPYGAYLKSCDNKKFTNDKKMTNQKILEIRN